MKRKKIEKSFQEKKKTQRFSNKEKRKFWNERIQNSITLKLIFFYLK